MFDSLIDLWNKWFGNGSGGSTTPTQPSHPTTSHQNHTHLSYAIELGKQEWGIPGEINGGEPLPLALTIQPLMAKESLVNLEDPYKVDAAKVKKLDKQIIINGVIAVEAGYVNHPSDKGGPTNFGITLAVANENKKMLVEKFGWNGDMKNLTHDMAFAIYEVNYWAKLKLDDIVKISAPVADKLFDIAVNCGVSRAGTWLQEGLTILNRRGKDYADIKVDGVVGSGSTLAFKSFMDKNGYKQGSKQLIRVLVSSQGRHYIDIALKTPSQEDFIHGWLNRLAHHLDYYSEMLK